MAKPKKIKIALSPEGKRKMAKSMGFTGPISQFSNFLKTDPSKQAQVKRLMKTARGGAIQMLKEGGVVGYAEGGMTKEEGQAMLNKYGGTTSGNTGDYSNLDTFKDYKFSDPNFQYKDFVKAATAAGGGGKTKGASDLNVAKGAGAGSFKYDETTVPDGKSKAVEEKPDTVAESKPYDVKKDMESIATDPTLKEGQKITPEKITVTDDQLIDDETGKLTGDQKGTATDDVGVTEKDPVKITDTVTTKADVEKELDELDPAKMTDEQKEKLKIDAEQQEESSVSDLKAAEGEAILMNNPTKREIQDGELIDSQVDPIKAAEFVEQIEAATATPTKKATVKGQLEELMADFEGGETPSWASGAMRAATARMNARGLSSSSMAGQAIIQAAMESALPIAQQDASTFAQFEGQNLSNRQAIAMNAAQQRAAFMKMDFDQKFQSKVFNASKIADVANMNFTAEQQVALENSRNANTVNLANLNNKQGLIMAEAAALSQLDMANLSNRQQTAVQNAQNFLAIDMANMSNEQQTNMFKAQANINSLFTDQAAQNATKQFNATSENQTNQFFAGLKAQVESQNATRKDNMSQFNANIANQRDQFEATNQMVIKQSNAQWRRQVATGDTASINRANEFNATALLGISNQAYANLWQNYGDTMERAWQTAENSQDRLTQLANTKMQVDGSMASAESERKANNISSIGGFLMNWLF